MVVDNQDFGHRSQNATAGPENVRAPDNSIESMQYRSLVLIAGLNHPLVGIILLGIRLNCTSNQGELFVRIRRVAVLEREIVKDTNGAQAMCHATSNISSIGWHPVPSVGLIGAAGPATTRTHRQSSLARTILT